MRVNFQIRQVMRQNRVANLHLKEYYVGLWDVGKKPEGKQGKLLFLPATDVTLSRAPRLSRNLLA